MKKVLALMRRRAAWIALGSLALMVIAALFGVAIYWPKLELEPTSSFAVPDGAGARIEALAKGLTPLAILIGIVVAAYRATVADKQADLAEQSQVTERFAQAMEMLGDEKRLSVRLGGIYALEGVAKRSPDYHWTVMDVLCAHVQANRPRGEGMELDPVPKDIQAILTVLGKRNSSAENGGERLGLSGANLENADLSNANLRYAEFRSAILRFSDLTDADLTGAHLVMADFSGADFSGANLHGADLTDAELDGAGFEGADLDSADLSGANFVGALFYSVDNKKITQDQINQAHGNSKTKLPGHLTRPEHWK